MKEISSEEYIEKIRNYTGFGEESERPNRQMHYVYALMYLGEKVEYTTEFIERYEDPIEILEYGKGRCGEFTIALTALLLSNGWNARMVYDVSAGEGNGDHMWVEIFAYPPFRSASEPEWIHIDPTEGAVWTKKLFINPFDNPYIDNPYIYERDWEKELTEVWGIEPTWCGRVEENYQWEQN